MDEQRYAVVCVVKEKINPGNTPQNHYATITLNRIK